MIPSSNSNEDNNALWYNSWKTRLEAGKSSPYPWLSFSVFRDGSYSVKPTGGVTGVQVQRPTTSGTYKSSRLLGTTRASSAVGHRGRTRRQRSPTPEPPSQYGHLSNVLTTRPAGRATPLSNVQVSVSGGVGSPTHTVIKTKYGRKIKLPAKQPPSQSIVPPETESTVGPPSTQTDNTTTDNNSGFSLSTEKGKPKKPPTPTNAGDIKDVENLEEVEKQHSSRKVNNQTEKKTVEEAKKVSPSTNLPQQSSSRERVGSYGYPNSIVKSLTNKSTEGQPTSVSSNSSTTTTTQVATPPVITPAEIVPKSVTHVVPVGNSTTSQSQDINDGNKPVFSFAHSATTTGNVTSLTYMSFLNKLQAKHNQVDSRPNSHNVVGVHHQHEHGKLPAATTIKSTSTTDSITQQATTTVTTTTTTLPTFTAQSLNKSPAVSQQKVPIPKDDHSNNEKPLYSVTDGSSTTEIYPIKSILKKGGGVVLRGSQIGTEKLSAASRPHTAGGSQRYALTKSVTMDNNVDTIRPTVAASRKTPNLMNGELSLRRSHSAGPKRGVRFDMTSNSVHEYEPAPSSQPPVSYVNDNEHWYKLMWKKLAEEQ